MPFVEKPKITGDDLGYYTTRMAECNLTQQEINDNQICLVPNGSLDKYGLFSKKTQGRAAIRMPTLGRHGQPTGPEVFRMIGDAPLTTPPPGIDVKAWHELQRKGYPRYLTANGFDLHFPRMAAWTSNSPVAFVTEGKFKALRACKEGLPCASIQGKDMGFRRTGVDLTANWAGILGDENIQKVFYIADSDYEENPSIQSAAIKLVGKLNALKRDPEFASLLVVPAVPGLPKTGLDDWINKNPGKFVTAFQSWLVEWEQSAWYQVVSAINERYAFVDVYGQVHAVDRKSGSLTKIESANDYCLDILLNAGSIITPGGRQLRGVPSIKNTVLSDVGRKIYDGVDFYPGMPGVIDVDDQSVYNRWRDKSPVLEDGDVTLAINQIEHTFPSIKDRDYIWRLFAHRILHPQEISPCAMWVKGPEGTGKSLSARLLFGSITAEDYTFIGEVDFSSDFFSRVFEDKQAVCVEDPTAGSLSRSDVESILKSIISGNKMTINRKHMAQYEVTMRALLWINTNNLYAPVSGDARRFSFFETGVVNNRALGAEVVKWMDKTENWQGKLRKWIVDNYGDKIGDLRGDLFQLEARSQILGENDHPDVVIMNDFLGNLPPELLEHGVVPYSVVNKVPPFNNWDPVRLSAFSKNIEKRFPLVRIAPPQNLVNVGGTTSRFRFTNPKDPRITALKLDPHSMIEEFRAEMRNVYKQWIDHPNFKQWSKF